VPLFPLERTFFPQETEKLFVFEPRYRVSAFSHAQRHSGSGVPSRVTG
jgi:Lon protease-like protein